VTYTELDQLVATSPVLDDEVESLDLTHAETELVQQIIAMPREAVPDVSGGGSARGRQRTWGRRLSGASAVAAVAVLVVVLTAGRGAHSDFADAAVKVAEANPRILLDKPGWSVVRADFDEFSVERGEMTFSDGEHYLDVYWRPASEYDDFMRDRAADGAARTSVTVVGRHGTRFLSPGSRSFTTLMPPEGPVFVEISGQVVEGERAYTELLGSLETVGVDTWLAALPASAVRPADRAAVVNRMLDGVPLPDGFPIEELRGGDAVKDHYSLAMEVSGAVACGWLDRWNQAKRAGDTAAMRESVDAMQTSHRWPVLLEMPPGTHNSTVWEYADQIAMRTPGYSGRDVDVKEGNDVAVRRNYVQALGCR
jgi:hypothetical protein